MEKRRKLTLILAAAVIAVALIAIVVFALNRNKHGGNDGSAESNQLQKVGNAFAGEGKLEADEDDEFLESFQAQTENWIQDAYVVSMSDSTWHFEDGSSPSYDMSLANDPTNAQTVYVEVVTADEEEVLFVSDYLEPGDSLYGVQLGKVLEKGEYECYLVYHLMDQEKKQETSTVTLALTVVVEN